jgi:hypothetical protein
MRHLSPPQDFDSPGSTVPRRPVSIEYRLDAEFAWFFVRGESAFDHPKNLRKADLIFQERRYGNFVGSA